MINDVFNVLQWSEWFGSHLMGFMGFPHKDCRVQNLGGIKDQPIIYSW